MRLLLFGATGFLGAHVRRAARTAGIEVTTAGRRSVDPATDAVPRVAALFADVAPDAVVNCVGVTGGDAATMSAANIAVPATLIEAMLRVRSPARLVHLGSAAEYGPGEPGVGVREDAPTRPVGLYGVTKLAGTRLVQVAYAAGMPAVALRVFNPVGIGAPTTSLPGRAAAEVARAAADGGVVRLGGLDVVRDFVAAADVAGAVLAAATRPTPDDSVLNIGSGRATSARELVATLLKVAGAAVPVEPGGSGSPRSVDVPWQRADIGAAHRALGWHPTATLDDSLTALWESLR